MRKTFCVIGLLYMCFCSSALAEEKELFPLKKLKLGISSDEFQKHYPNAKLVLQDKKDENGKTLEALWLCEIENNVFWDSAMAYIKDDKLKTWAYVKAKDFNQARQNVPMIYEKLVEQFGNVHKKLVVEHLSKGPRLKAPLFVWSNETQTVTFSHTPIDKYKSEALFKCELKIMEAKTDLQQRFTILKDNASEMPELFTDVLRAAHEKPEEPSAEQQPPAMGARSLLLIIATTGLGGILFVSVFLLLKKKSISRGK